MIYRASKTSQEYKAQSQAHSQEREDSFDRCDTDGFLSQWASGINAQIDSALADLADRGGVWTFKVLADLNGTPVHAKPIETKYGMSWAVMNERGKFIDFAAYHPKRAQTLTKKGYQEIEIDLPAVVKTSSARGSYNISIQYWAEQWL